MNDHIRRPPLTWSTQLTLLPLSSTPPLRGDKIVLPPSALEALLSAATVTIANTSQPQTSAFDPYNPYSFAAERQARDQLLERQQQLPHPLTFKLVNPKNGRVVFAGIREFSAEEGCIGLSNFLKESLGFDSKNSKVIGGGANMIATRNTGEEAAPKDDVGVRLTIHVQEIPKGSFVRLRPLEAGYDSENWKALLEYYLRENFTTLTNGEVLAIPSGKELFRFLVDGLKPNEDAVTLVDTDLEVDIEPLNEEQAKETLKKLAEKSKRAPAASEGSSLGGLIQVDADETGQVLPGEYVDYSIEQWDRSQHIQFEVTATNPAKRVDLFVTPFGSQHRGRPREDEHVFGDFSNRPTKRINIRYTNAELENAGALWVSVRGCDNHSDALKAPLRYNLQASHIDDQSLSENENLISSDSAFLGQSEERCSNCQQIVPKRTMFLHQNFCLRNNIFCPLCRNVFQKSSVEWTNHWHCPHDFSYGSDGFSHTEHDRIMHTPQLCSSCDYQAANVPDLAHHRTSTCPGKIILCQFCHLQVPQQGPDDPPPESAEVIISGLTPHEVSDGARTTECHICRKIVRLRDMPPHLRIHDHQRLSRQAPRVCRNANCGHTTDGVGKDGEVRLQGPRNELGVCDTCFGPLYNSTYDPDGKALKRRVERRYLTQLLTGCGQIWCRNEFCKSGRKNLGLLIDSQTILSKEALTMIKPILGSLRDFNVPLHFCADEPSQRRRILAEMLAAEGAALDVKGKGKGKAILEGGAGYGFEWSTAALEVEANNLDRARQWLKDYAPTIAESGK